MKFLDSTKLRVVAGKGGDGMVAFMRAKFRPNLGPSGGNGGLGGDVILRGDKGLSTLASLRYGQIYRAENGGRGGPNNRTGHCGSAKTLRVPLGTKVYDAETGDYLNELTADGEELVIAKGGKRGYGNRSYMTSTNQAPRQASPGKEGDALDLRLELSLMADVGLVGFPNAGKSSMIRRLTDAKPLVADYPFSTLEPLLGVVDPSKRSGSYSSDFVIADIPGLIEGASLGKGLGHKFLRHIERTRILVFVLDGFGDQALDALEAYHKLHNELTQFDPKLGEKPSLIALNKKDLAIDSSQQSRLSAAFAQLGITCITVSAATGEGLIELERELVRLLADI